MFVEDKSTNLIGWKKAQQWSQDIGMGQGMKTMERTKMFPTRHIPQNKMKGGTVENHQQVNLFFGTFCYKKEIHYQ